MQNISPPLGVDVTLGEASDFLLRDEFFEGVFEGTVREGKVLRAGLFGEVAVFVNEVDEEGVGAFFFGELAQLILVVFLAETAAGTMTVEDAGSCEGGFARPVADDDAIIGKGEESFVESDLGKPTLAREEFTI